MANSYTYIPYSETGYFSKLVNDYADGKPELQQFYSYAPDLAGVKQAIDARRTFPVDRQRLVSALSRQYEGVAAPAAVLDNIGLLLEETTYTVTTAHQPNLMTGYLYFIYKILHAIKLAEQLNRECPGKHFVPVYYMGSEDNDIEELGVFRYGGEKYVWDGDGQTGAVGRMDPIGLKPLLERLFKVLGPPGEHSDVLRDMISKAYLQHDTIGKATQYLVNELFGRYGLVILDPDDAELKAAFVQVMQDELLRGDALGIISRQTEELEAAYKAQMFPRPINLFYLAGQVRERIEKQGDKWVVVNTAIEFTKDELLSELKGHPERFSPNVALRGLYQETILPDVAFIGGGAEVAYWLQLRTLFAHYNVFYPVVLLRQSVLWIDEIRARLREQTGLNIAALFLDDAELERKYVADHSSGDWQTAGETVAMEKLFENLNEKATTLDPTLGPSAAAVLKRIKHQLAVLEKKMLRAEKRKMDIQLKRVNRLKDALFPRGSLQERTDNFAEYYLQYGSRFFDAVKDGIEPLGGGFLVVE